MKLDAVKQALLASYERDGGINHLDGPNLPSQASVGQLAFDYMHLLFPGYFEELATTRKDLPQWLEKLLGSFAGRLTADLEKCLRFAGVADASKQASLRAGEALAKLPELRRLVQTDVTAAFRGDPAARSVEEIIVAYPCVLAISLQRFAHELYLMAIPLLPRLITEYGHERTGCDLHPGATIGEYFFIDHPTGVVVGETATVGARVKLYQGVTLGAKSFAEGPDGQLVKGVKRHPDIEDDVVVYAHATILGGDTRIGAHSVIGSNVWLLKSVPPDSVAYHRGEDLVIRTRRKQDKFVEKRGAEDWQI